METGIMMSVTNRSAAAMLTNKKPVRILASGLFVTMKIRSTFPVKATGIVKEYNTVNTVICKFAREVELSVQKKNKKKE